jgi:hypothetical protein
LAIHLLYLGGYPNVLFNILKTMSAYVVFAHGEDANGPCSLEDLQEKYALKIVATSGVDADMVGTYKKHRVVVYINKDREKSFYLLLDSWLTWRLVNPSSPQDPPFPAKVSLAFHVASTSPLEFNEDDAMDNAVSISRADFTDVVNIFQGHPPAFPPRPVVASLEGLSTAFISIVFAGNTIPFKSRFDIAGIGRKKGDPLANSSFPEWHRVVPQMDISLATGLDEVYEIFTEVLEGSPVFVRIKTFPSDDSRFKLLTKGLKARPGVAFLS